MMTMMKHATLLLLVAVLAPVVATDPSGNHLRRAVKKAPPPLPGPPAVSTTPTNCFDIYPGVYNGTLDGHTYAGLIYSVDLIHVDGPIYATLADATAETSAIGRIIGFFSEVTLTGPIALEFYDTGSTLTVILGRSATTSPNVITGGNGCFLGAIGTVTRVVISSDQTFKYTICTAAPLPCSP
jgi:hypothetical protein